MESMKTLLNPTKCDMLLQLFDEVGKTMEVSAVCEITGISNYNSLKSLFSYIRRSKHIPIENRISVHIQDGTCIRTI